MTDPTSNPARLVANLGPVPSRRWSPSFRARLGAEAVVDLPLPEPPPDAAPAEIERAVAAVVERVPAEAARVLVAGEPTVVFRAVDALRARGHACYAPLGDPSEPGAGVRPFPGAEPVSLEEREVGGVRFRWDRAHMEAHLPDLALSLDELLAEVARRLPPPGARPEGPFAVTDRLDRVTGWSRLVALRPGDRAWWGRRPGRRAPSHLVDRPPEPTRELTAWLRPEPDGALRVLTLYAGRPAPREIHDPEIPPGEIDASIEFWTRHALAVGAPAGHGSEGR